MLAAHSNLHSLIPSIGGWPSWAENGGSSQLPTSSFYKVQVKNPVASVFPDVRIRVYWSLAGGHVLYYTDQST